MLQRKKDINTKNKVSVTHSLFPYYRFLWGKCKDLQGKGRISQVFCLEAVMTIRVTVNSPVIKILHEKDLIVYQECPTGFCVKDFFLVLLQLLLNSAYMQILDRPMVQTIGRLLPAPSSF